MELELSLSGFMITREDWDSLDDDSREIFTAMLEAEGRSPRFVRRDQRRAAQDLRQAQTH